MTDNLKMPRSVIMRGTYDYSITNVEVEYVRGDLSDGIADALKDFMKIAARAKPNCGPSLRATIQAAQEKHRSVLSDYEGTENE